MRKYLMTLFHEIYLDHVYASQPAHHQSINIFSKTQSLFFSARGYLHDSLLILDQLLLPHLSDIFEIFTLQVPDLLPPGKITSPLPSPPQF